MGRCVAYAQAGALTRRGQPLSVTNRAMVIVPAGLYDLQTTQLLMNTEFVDLVGLSFTREEQHDLCFANRPGWFLDHLRSSARQIR